MHVCLSTGTPWYLLVSISERSIPHNNLASILLVYLERPPCTRVSGDAVSLNSIYDLSFGFVCASIHQSSWVWPLAYKSRKFISHHSPCCKYGKIKFSYIFLISPAHPILLLFISHSKTILGRRCSFCVIILLQKLHISFQWVD